MVTINVGQATNSNIVGTAVGSNLISGVRNNAAMDVLLERFEAECKRVFEALPKASKESALDDVTTVVTEASSKAPDAGKLKIALSRAVDRVNTLTNFASPIVGIAKDILELVTKLQP